MANAKHSLNRKHFMYHVNSVLNRPAVPFFNPHKAVAEFEAGQEQIPEQSAALVPVEVVKCFRAENGFMVLDHVYVVSDR